VERVERSVEVDCPIRAVYNQWTQFEEFPRFMSGVKEVKKLDETRVHWHAEVWGKDKEWDAEITELVPDARISWRSTSGDDNAGTVRFEPLPGNRTLVRLAMGYQPTGVIENTSDALGAFTSHIESTVKDFKSYIEEQRTAANTRPGDSERRRRP
jgi:uncharacterized membrane protein